MALPLKSGADFYTQQALRMALHNEMADLSDHIPGSIYFNNHDTSSLSDRVRYRGLKDWHSVANMEDIEDVKDLIKALSGSLSESVASVLGRVITLEGYFSNGVAKDAELLDGHNSDYFATASGLSALQEKVSAFLDGEADSDAVLENLKEIQAFLDSYDGATSLADMFGAVNTQIADRYTKAEADARYLKLTGGELTGQLKINAPNWAQQLILDTTSNSSGIRFNVNGSLSGVLRSTGGYLQWYVKDGEDYILLHSGNYSDLITTLNGNLSVGGNLTVSGNSINLGNADSITAVAGTFSVNKSATFKENVFFTSAEGVYINRTSINWGKEFGFVSPLINFAADQITVKQKATIEGDLYVTGHIIADGQVSSGGIGSEGSGSGASGIVILEDWEKYDDTLAQVLGAGLGVGLRDKIAKLESKATNVSVAQTLTSGKEIGAITIDGVATKLFAPDDYLPLSGGTLNGSLGMTSAEIPDGAVGLWGTGSLYLKASDKVSFYNSSTGAFNEILHEGNYDSVLDNAYLKLSGGGITGSLTVGRTDSSTPLYVTNSFTPYTAIAFRGSTLKYAYLIYSGTGDTWEVTNEGWGRTSVLLHANNFNTYALPITGGEMTGLLTLKPQGYHAIDIVSPDNNLAQITMSTNDTLRGILQYNTNFGFGFHHSGCGGLYVASDGVPKYVDSSSAKYPILHEGNYNLYAPTLTGTGASGTWAISAAAIDGGMSGTIDANVPYNTKVTLKYRGSIASASTNVPVTNSWQNAILEFGLHENGAVAQLYVSYQKGLYYRSSLDSAWKEFAFTDSNVASATKLQTARTIWGQSFDGTGDVSGTLYYVNNIYPNSEGERYIGTSSNPFKFMYAEWYGAGAGKTLSFGANNGTHLFVNTSGNVTIGSSDYAQQNCKLFVDGAINVGTYGALHRDVNNHLWVNYGGSAAEKNLIICGYNTSFYYGKGSNYQSAMFINSSGNVGIGTTAPQEKLHVVGNLHVTGNIIADGQVSSGGVAEAGTGGATGGSGLDRLVFEIPANTTSFPCEHGLGTRDISVSIYEKGNDFQQVLADVYLDSTNVARIVFGAATDVAHKVVIIG